MKKTILLVDDESFILQALKRLLSEENYQILTADNGQEALTLLKNNAIQVIISDQRMQHMTGFELIKKVRKLYPTISCLILSAYVDFEALKDALNEETIYRFISKPWQDDILLHYVSDAFKAHATKKEIAQTGHEPVQHDPLTGLQNRYSFFEFLWSLIADVKKDQGHFAIAYFDIDQFGKLNTIIGPNKSDTILQQLAKRLKTFIKNENYVARMGNDEFAVVLMGPVNDYNLKTVLKALLSVIKKLMIIDGNKISLTVSMGVCSYPQQGNNADLIMTHAGLALQRSKELGGDGYQLYKQDQDKAADAQSFLRNEVYQALGKKQFHIYYQPIYTMDKSKLVSVEALIRWQHPKQGLLLPGKFLNFFEKTNLIVPVGAWVLRVACQQVKQWQNLGFPELTLAVNLSAHQINHPLFLDLIADVLETTQLTANCLILEITETLIMQDTDKVIAILNSLRQIGVELSLDDFGTGYSSLSYLRKFPFTSLKLDQSFVNAMTETTTATAIVDAIISLGKALNLKIIAEGVETEEQLALLQGKKCDFIQGYLFSKPLPTVKFESLLMKYKNKKIRENK